MIEARRQWLENAASLISDLRHKRVFVSKMFPQKEYLRPLNTLTKYWQHKVGDFFTKDPAHLVSLHKITICYMNGKKMDLEKENHQMKDLREAMDKARAVQSQIKEFIQTGSGSYSEAKYFYGELL